MTRPLTKTDVIYLSGPMSGYQYYNFEVFNRAAADLRSRGYKVINPAEFGVKEGWEYKQYLQRDLNELFKKATAVAVLPGWEKSVGAKVEVEAAKSIELPIYNSETLEPYNPNRCVLETAKELVSGERQALYGPPNIDFRRTAGMLTALFEDKLKPWQRIEPREVGLMLICVKLSREYNGHKHDNLVDIAGYAKCMEMMVEANEKYWNDLTSGALPLLPYDEDDDNYPTTAGLR